MDNATTSAADLASELAIPVEILSNVLYLLELSGKDPEQASIIRKLGDEALARVRELMQFHLR